MLNTGNQLNGYIPNDSVGEWGTSTGLDSGQGGSGFNIGGTLASLSDFLGPLSIIGDLFQGLICYNTSWDKSHAENFMEYAIPLLVAKVEEVIPTGDYEYLSGRFAHWFDQYADELNWVAYGGAGQCSAEVIKKMALHMNAVLLSEAKRGSAGMNALGFKTKVATQKHTHVSSSGFSKTYTIPAIVEDTSSNSIESGIKTLFGGNSVEKLASPSYLLIFLIIGLLLSKKARKSLGINLKTR